MLDKYKNIFIVYHRQLTDRLAIKTELVLDVYGLVALVSVARVAHVEVLALDALVAPALLRRVLAAAGGLARDVALGVVAAVALLARYRVARVAVPVAFAAVTRER